MLAKIILRKNIVIIRSLFLSKHFYFYRLPQKFTV